MLCKIHCLTLQSMSRTKHKFPVYEKCSNTPEKSTIIHVSLTTCTLAWFCGEVLRFPRSPWRRVAPPQCGDD